MARVLLVDDDDLVRDILREELSVLGHWADCAKTKAEAEALLGSRSHDLMVCDLVLPDGNGRQLAHRAAVELGIPCVLMTGYRDVSDEMLFAGVLHISKPFSLGTFRDVLKHHLGEGVDIGMLTTKAPDLKRADQTTATFASTTAEPNATVTGDDDPKRA